jgi:hypothetical protein
MTIRMSRRRLRCSSSLVLSRTKLGSRRRGRSFVGTLGFSIWYPTKLCPCLSSDISRLLSFRLASNGGVRRSETDRQPERLGEVAAELGLPRANRSRSRGRKCCHCCSYLIVGNLARWLGLLRHVMRRLEGGKEASLIRQRLSCPMPRLIVRP